MNFVEFILCFVYLQVVNFQNTYRIAGIYDRKMSSYTKIPVECPKQINM